MTGRFSDFLLNKVITKLKKLQCNLSSMRENLECTNILPPDLHSAQERQQEKHIRPDHL